MARAKKDIEKEVVEGLRKLPVKKKAQVLDFVQHMVEAEKKRKQKKLSPGAAFMKRLFTEGLYDGDGEPYDIDEVVYGDRS